MRDSASHLNHHKHEQIKIRKLEKVCIMQDPVSATVSLWNNTIQIVLCPYNFKLCIMKYVYIFLAHFNRLPSWDIVAGPSGHRKAIYLFHNALGSNLDGGTQEQTFIQIGSLNIL